MSPTGQSGGVDPYMSSSSTTKLEVSDRADVREVTDRVSIGCSPVSLTISSLAGASAASDGVMTQELDRPGGACLGTAEFMMVSAMLRAMSCPGQPDTSGAAAARRLDAVVLTGVTSIVSSSGGVPARGVGGAIGSGGASARGAGWGAG